MHATTNRLIAVWSCRYLFSYFESDRDGRTVFSSVGPTHSVNLTMKQTPMSEDEFRDFLDRVIVDDVMDS